MSLISGMERMFLEGPLRLLWSAAAMLPLFLREAMLPVACRVASMGIRRSD